MKQFKVLTISNLLQHSRPFAGTCFYSVASKFSCTSSNPNPNFIEPFTCPAIIIGTVTLPLHKSSCSKNSCFSFSDGKRSICCDVLDFDLRMIGNEIHVLSWNAIPFRPKGLFLEIISWVFPESDNGIRNCSKVFTFPLSLDLLSTGEDDLKDRFSIMGAVESVSPISTHLCTNSNARVDSHCDNLRGFLAQLRVCECQLCNSRDSPMGLCDVIEGHMVHLFTNSLLVYFCGSPSYSHPVITNYVGKILSLSGLKKKLLFIGKEECQLIYITTEKSFLNVPRQSNKCFPFRMVNTKDKVKCYNYTGIVKGIYLQGMVVELDEEVWLLLTNQSLIAPHSLRVGAIISVQNVHFVNPRFAWTKMLILGTCCKTSIKVNFYSPMSTKVHMISQSRSLLREFIDTLPFSIRLWVLLVVLCFKKKFSGMLSEKEILGSNHKEGFAQIYAKSHLCSSIFRSKHGIFTEFCKHNLCGYFVDSDCGQLKLVLPICNFLSHCETIWIKTQLQSENCGIQGYNKQHSFWLCKGRSYSQSITRTFSSEEIGFILLGNLKLSPCYGRLQFMDATGSIDVVIDGLPSTWNANGLYEVKDYNIVMEGIPERALQYESFSCRNIFDGVQAKTKINISVYAYFHWRDVAHINLLLYPCKDWNDKFKELESGTFHLLCVTHKFPVPQKFRGKEFISSMFAEAMIVPWNLFLSGKVTDVSKDGLKEPMENCTSKTNHNHNFHKRRRIDFAFRKGSCSYVNNVDKIIYNNQSTYFKPLRKSSQDCRSHNSNLLRIQFLSTVRRDADDTVCNSGYLYSTKAKEKCDIASHKVLLEFDLESFVKYEMLKIGNYYITKHHTEEFFCKINSSDYKGNDKVLITSRTCLWSVSFSSDEVSINKRLEITSDISLQLLDDASILNSDLKSVTDCLIKPSLTAEENVSLRSQIPMNLSVHSLETTCLPVGRLISSHGRVLAVHSFDSNPLDAHLRNQIGGQDRRRVFQQFKTSVCIHVLVDHQIVRISSAFRKYSYPVGFGPGVVATFHRILESSVENEQLMTAVSFITIDSVTNINDHDSQVCFDLGYVSNLYNITSANTVSPGLISELIKSLDVKTMQLCCRVVSVHIVTFGNVGKYKDVQSIIHPRLHVNIPLAGFVMDDGSASCCCWANGERASTLLKLEGISEKVFSNSEKAHKISDCLAIIFEKYGMVTVKNYGTAFDSSCQDVVISVNSNTALSPSDEDLLISIISNTCVSPLWNIEATVMNSSCVAWLERNLKEMQMCMHKMYHFWAAKVDYVNPLTEARRIMQELLNTNRQASPVPLISIPK